MSYKVGDRVETTRKVGGIEKGAKGTIKIIQHDQIGVRFDDYFLQGHDLNGKVDCPTGYGWYVTMGSIRLIPARKNLGQMWIDNWGNHGP